MGCQVLIVREAGVRRPQGITAIAQGTSHDRLVTSEGVVSGHQVDYSRAHRGNPTSQRRACHKRHRANYGAIVVGGGDGASAHARHQAVALEPLAVVKSTDVV